MMIKIFLTILWSLLISTVAMAAVQTKTIPYQHGDITLEGHLAWDDAVKVKRPGVLVVHEWWGLNDYARQRAEQLAEMGYVAFALDMYGTGKVTQHADQAGKWMRAVQANVDDWQARAIKGLTILREHALVDAERIAAIGYCFGGATVMQLAYSGADVQGVVSFHGSLPIPDVQQASRTRAKILIAHGNADPFISEEHIKKFRTKLDEVRLDWQMIVYSGARHSFTNPGADQHGIDALKYNKEADERSWHHMMLFFTDIFSLPR